VPHEQIEVEMPDLVLHVLDDRRLLTPPSAEQVVEGVAGEAPDTLVGAAAPAQPSRA